MTTYIINILFMIVFAAILLLYIPFQWGKKAFCIIVSIQLILLSGLRHYSIGTDTYQYKLYYEEMGNRSWSNLWAEFINILFKGAEGKDPGYAIFEKIIHTLTNNYQVYLIVIALIFTVPLGIWIYKNSREPFISFLIYLCLFFSFFGITGHRQTIATALVVFIGYKFIKERDFWPFLALILIAFTIHKSSFVFLLYYFLANKKITKKYLFLMSGIITAMFTFKNQAMFILGTHTGYEQFIEQYKGAGTGTFTLLLSLIMVVTIWKHEKLLKNNPQVAYYINALLIAMLFTPLTYVDPTAMRIVQYFSVFIMLLIPEIVELFNKREKILIYYAIVTLLIVLFTKNNPQYLFFW